MNAAIVFGAASKGIIKRDQQNNAIVYKTYYAAANPFQQMDTNDLEKYKKEIAQKQMKEQGIKFKFYFFQTKTSNIFSNGTFKQK